MIYTSLKEAKIAASSEKNFATETYRDIKVESDADLFLEVLDTYNRRYDELEFREFAIPDTKLKRYYSKLARNYSKLSRTVNYGGQVNLNKLTKIYNHVQKREEIKRQKVR